FESLLSLKDFWLKTLDRIQTVHLQPLPCPVGENVLDMPIDALRKLAIHAYSLKRNWSSELALPVSVNTIALGAEYREICVIHGTNMVVTNSPEQLACWDTQSGACLGTIDHEGEDDTTNYQQSPPFHLPSQSLIGLSTAFRATWHPAATLDDKTIGLIVTNHYDQLSTLAYCNFNDAVIHFVPMGMRLGADPKCALVNGHFYVYGQEQRDDPAIVLRVCVATHEVEQITVEIPSSIPAIHGKSRLLGHAWLVHSTSRVTLISQRLIQTLPSFPGPPQDIDSVHFWPASGSAARLEFEALTYYEHYFHITRVAVGINGRYAAVLDMEPRGNAGKPKNNLGIVHNAAHPVNHTSFHLLDTAGVELNYYTVLLALDDTLGVVYYTHIGRGEEATLTVLSYA
ncbi:hypothetical protein B0H19DRAFT_1289334, partial [Mycena capillaripes]